MGRIGSTKLVLPNWHQYRSYNRVVRVPRYNLNDLTKLQLAAQPNFLFMLVYRSMLLLTSLHTSFSVAFEFWWDFDFTISDKFVTCERFEIIIWPRWPQKQPFKNIFQRASNNNNIKTLILGVLTRKKHFFSATFFLQ